MPAIRKAAAAGLVLAVVAALCRVASLAKEFVVAGVFGAGAAMDAYALAMLIPAIGMALFVTAVQRAYLMQLPRIAAEGPEEARRFAGQFFVSLLAVTALGALIASPLLRRGWPWLIAGDQPEVMAESIELVTWACWLLVPIAAVAALTAVLNAQHRFARPQATAVIPTIAIVVAVAIFGRQFGAKTLLAGLFVGTIIQAAALWVMVQRSGVRPRLGLDIRSPAFTVLWRVALPLIVLGVLSQLNIYVDRTMASTLPEGNIAILAWSGTIRDVLTGTVIGSLLWVLLPGFAEQAAEGRHDELRRWTMAVMRYAAVLLLPAAALIAVCLPSAAEGVTFGRLDAAATGAIASCVAAYSIGLPADLASTTLYQGLMALGRLRTLFLLSVLANFIPNLVFNLLLIGPLGAPGLALSTAIVGYTTLAANYWALRRVVGATEELRTIRSALGAFAAAVASAGAAWGVLHSSGGLWQAIPGGPQCQSLLAAATGVVAYALLMLVFPGNADARYALRLVRERMAGK